MGLSTTPRTWATGELINAAMLNTEVRDNMVALGAGTIMGTPTSTASNGTVTSAGTETRDAVLGNYTFTAVAGRRYRAVIDGLQFIPSVAADVYTFTIRNGGASTPTAASTAVASAKTQGLAAATGQTVPLAGTFVPGAGTVTLGLFAVRIAGSGTATPTSNVVNRELYAVDLGPA